MSAAPKVSSLALAFGLLALGCNSVSVDPGMDLEPGIDLPGSTDGDGDTTMSPDGDDDPGRVDGSTSGDDPTSGGDDESGSTGEPADDDDDGPPTCADETIQLEIAPPQVMLLLDKSGSMIQNSWDHDADIETGPITRWNSLYNVVDQLSHSVENGIELGMVLFPSASLTETNAETACIVDSDPGAMVSLGNADSIVGALPAPDSMDIHGGTPVSTGMSVVLEHLGSVADGRPQAVVLVTDGAANCMAGTSGNDVFTLYDEDLEPMVSDAFTAGIPTYVVGVDILDEVGVYPADNPYVRLNELAVAGGVPQDGGLESFYNTTDEEQLLLALDAIAAELGCNIDLTLPAEFANQVTVSVGGMDLPRVEECGDDGVGWRFLEEVAPFTSIELCSETCDLVHVEASLDVEYECIPQG